MYGGALPANIAEFVLAVTRPTILSATPPACLSLGAVCSILYSCFAAKRKTSSDLYADSGSIRINRAFEDPGTVLSYTSHVGLRFQVLVSAFTTSGADLDFVKWQYIIWLPRSRMRSQYLYPLADVWAHENASIAKHWPAIVGL